MKFVAVFCACLLLTCPDLGKAAETPAALFQAQGHSSQNVEGWTLLVNENLLKEHPEKTQAAIELLKKQLLEIVQVVPAPAVARLREVKLWFEPEYKGIGPRAEYHPGIEWLKDNHRNPLMVKSVEFTNILNFDRELRRMPNFALHELAHAFHDQVLSFDQPDIVAAYKQAKESKKYDSVDHRSAEGKISKGRSYAMANQMEYFAECTEAFFSTNDIYPFRHDELVKHDPEMAELLKRVWNSLNATPKP